LQQDLRIVAVGRGPGEEIRADHFQTVASRLVRPEKELTGKDSEPSELIFFKVYRSQIPVIEQAIETAALMLGSDKSRGYCLEMICADFLAGAAIDGNNTEILLQSISRYYKFLPAPQQEAFRSELAGQGS